MDQALRDLITISRAVGQDWQLVQGGGGNTSVKTADGARMYIKASGTSLKDMDAERGWRRLRVGEVLAVLADKDLGQMEAQRREALVGVRLQAACDDELAGGGRPSVESHFHAMLGRCVIHLHPVAVGAYVNAKEGQERLERLFSKEGVRPLWVSYVDPGMTLASKMARLVAWYEREEGCKPAVVFLGKHGLVVSAKRPEEALRLVRLVVGRCAAALPKVKSRGKRRGGKVDVPGCQLAIRAGYFQATGRYEPVVFVTNETVEAACRGGDTGKLLGAGPLTPDEEVYANGAPLWVGTSEASALAAKVSAGLSRRSKAARAVLVKDVGLFVVGELGQAETIGQVATGSLAIRQAAARMGGVSALTRRQVAFIDEWEAESFRQKLTESGGGGVLRERIAVVTGAGSGLGRSIAIGLARAGAYVALADIDVEAAGETAAMIEQDMAGAVTMAVRCNVTDPASVAAGFASVVSRWGGLDMLVNAAGVAPAYSLVDFPVDKWRFALEVNLTGYMLMAQAAARVMLQQGMGGSIVNISSKSGLDASKNNGAYNATKAGELHMARGWAMELGEHGIRVNCVCPGNVFEGSKIWNPSYIKVCAKKYGIKPEEVIPYYVDKTVLKREIKGQDIADSVVFLCSDQARTMTGQTLVADSGQVMVR